MNLIDRIRTDIQERLDALLSEADKLRKALQALDPRGGSSSASSRRSPASTSNARRSAFTTSPLLASFESVVEAVPRVIPVAAETSPAVLAFPSESASRTRRLVAPGGVRRERERRADGVERPVLGAERRAFDGEAGGRGEEADDDPPPSA